MMKAATAKGVMDARVREQPQMTETRPNVAVNSPASWPTPERTWWEAAKTGAQAMVVSNHGGRQLDGAPSSIEVLPEIVEAVGAQMEIMFDGGIRSGQDVMRALALGAKSCMIGRAYIHGLGAFGGPGVAKAIDLIANELSTTMGLCGVNSIADIDERVIAV